MKWKPGRACAIAITIALGVASVVCANDYVVVDTGQKKCYDTSAEIPFPLPGAPFNGQDAQCVGTPFAFQDNGDGTVTDLNTGLMWQQVPDAMKHPWFQAGPHAQSLVLAGHSDWRLPTVKELYSLIDYGKGWPYIDTDYLDCDLDPQDPKNTQYWSSTEYVGLTHGGQATAFGVNFATGHIKGYGTGMPGFVRCVRGDSYGENDFVDNGDGTVTDLATGLVWQQADDGVTRNWEDALAYAEGLTLAGHDDWRLPNAKELQSIVDYTHSPNAANSSDLGPAIDTNFFSVSELPPGTTLYDPDYGYFWTNTSGFHSTVEPEHYYGWYVAIGTAVDDMNSTGEDMHGAGAVRFDAKTEGAPLHERIYNYVLCVRGGIGTSLTADAYTVSAASGGAIDLALDAGAAYVGRDYVVLGGMSGTQPGHTFGTGITLPLNPDPYMGLIGRLINSPYCVNFAGTLDGSGNQSATLNSLGALPSGWVGNNVYFAYLLINPIDFASNPIVIEIEP